MFRIFRAPVENLKVNLRSVKTDGIGITLLLTLVSIIILANIYRVVNNAQRNYEVYLYEKEQWKNLEENYEKMEKQYEFISSDEAKMLLARDMLNLGKSSESLFTTKRKSEYYQVQAEYIEVREKNDFKNWWFKLGI